MMSVLLFYVLVASATAVIAVHAARLTAAAGQQPWTTAHTLQHTAGMCSNNPECVPHSECLSSSECVNIWRRYFNTNRKLLLSESVSLDQAPWRQQRHLIVHCSLCPHGAAYQSRIVTRIKESNQEPFKILVSILVNLDETIVYHQR